MPAPAPKPVTIVDKGAYRRIEVTTEDGHTYEMFTSEAEHGGRPVRTVLSIQSLSFWDDTPAGAAHIFETYGGFGELITENSAVFVYPETQYRAEYDGFGTTPLIIRYANTPEQAIREVLSECVERAEFLPLPSVTEKYLTRDS